MAFNSYSFILAFLPICIIGYFALGRFYGGNLSKAFLILSSLVFYGWSNPKFLLIILPSIAINFLASILFDKYDARTKKIILILAIIINVLLLLYFKYQNFFISNLNRLLKADYVLKDIILPLGISFITFQQISYLVDSYKGEVKKCNIFDYVLLVMFFPHVISGPLFDSNDFIEQINDSSRKKLNWDNVARGILLFSIGLAKKVLIADTFGIASNWGFSDVGNLDATNAIIVVLSYTFQIYFDFSGYCDMAMGISQILNFEIPINFNSPYKAFLITDFWKRWHITLTKFLTTYIYIPLGGNRQGTVRTYVNTIIVFLISGFWHGAAWTFVIWGLMHGVACVICKHFKKQFEGLHKALAWMITFGFINVAWVFFRASSVYDALVLLKRIVLFDFGNVNSNVLSAFNRNELNILPIVFLVITLVVILRCENSVTIAKRVKLNIGTALLAAAIITLCVLSLSSVGTFVYFNF